MYYFLTTISATSSLATTFTTTNYALLQLTTFTPEITTYTNTSTSTYLLILL